MSIKMSDVYIVSSCRTAIGSFNGCYSKIAAYQLGGNVINNCLLRTNIDPNDVSEVIMGHVLTAGQGQNPARQAALLAKLPPAIPAYTINMVCGSGLKAIYNGYNAIRAGEAKVIIAGGQENMTLAEHSIHLRQGKRFGNAELKDTVLTDGLTDAFLEMHMGLTAEHLATTFKVSREVQDNFAVKSQVKTKEAQDKGYFISEIVPVEPPNSVEINIDEFPKPSTCMEALTKLKPAFHKDGTVTAGNSSGINDGAAAVALCSLNYIEEHDLVPEALIVACAQVGCEPIEMGLAPVAAIEKVLARANWAKSSVDLFEINEAFSVQSVLVIDKLNIDPNKVNVSGGAIALGHPIGASGARVLVTLIHNLKRLEKKRGIAALCIGGGMGIAIAIQRCV